MSEEKKGIADAENSGTAETMADYARELEASFRTIREGDVISGTVIDVRETGVTLDLGYYAPAVIKTEDLSKDPSFSVLADIHVGDTLEGTVVKRDDGAGNIQMSCVEAAETLGWDRLKQYQEEKTILKIKVSESVNQGVTAYVEGIRGFIPASQLALDYDGVCRENAGSARDYGGFRPPEACAVRKGRPERKGSGAPEP